MSTLGSCCRANFPSTESSTAGLSLLAQPAAFTISVRRVVLTSDMQLHSSKRWRRAQIEERQLAVGSWQLAFGNYLFGAWFGGLVRFQSYCTLRPRVERGMPGNSRLRLAAITSGPPGGTGALAVRSPDAS